MKKYLFLLTLLFCNVSFAKDENWIYENSTSTYEIQLSEKNGEIDGHYCFVTKNGNKIDCPKKNNLKGRGNKIELFSEWGGNATATINKNNGILKISFIDKSVFENNNMHIKDIIILNKTH